MRSHLTDWSASHPASHWLRPSSKAAESCSGVAMAVPAARHASTAAGKSSVQRLVWALQWNTTPGQKRENIRELDMSPNSVALYTYFKFFISQLHLYVHFLYAHCYVSYGTSYNLIMKLFVQTLCRCFLHSEKKKKGSKGASVHF